MTASLHVLAARRKPASAAGHSECPTCLARAVRADLAAQVARLHADLPVAPDALAQVLARLDTVLATVDANNRRHGITD